MDNSPRGTSGPAAFGKSLLLLALACLAGVLIWKMFFGDGTLSNFFQTPQKVDVTYVPSDFNPDLDEENTLAILANPERYHKEFDQLVYKFNVELLQHVANRMNLPDSLRRRLEPLYKTHHDYLKTLYFNDFVALKDTTTALYETWYSDNGNQAVQVFNEVAGKYTCFFVTQIMATLLKTNAGAIVAKGKGIAAPCEIALKEGLAPMVARLKKRAEIEDFTRSRGLLKDKVQQGIAQLATYEIRSRKAINKQLTYDIFGINLSTTEVEVQAISIIKAGFDLNEYFDVTMNPKKGVVYVTLPMPKILSHEVYPRVDKLDVGFLAGINPNEMNSQFNALRREFRVDAIENDHILAKAQQRADSVLQIMLGGVVRSINRNYKLQLRIRDYAEQPATEEELRRRGEENPERARQPQVVPQAPGRRGTGFVPQ